MRLLLTTLLVFIHLSSSLAQETVMREQMLLEPNAFAIQHGYGWYAMLLNGEIDVMLSLRDQNGELRETAFEADYSSGAAKTLIYQRQLNKVISVGASGGHQRIRLDDFRNEDVERLSGSIKLNRTFISGMAQFHYGNAAKIDMYSGIKIGATVYTLSSSLEYEDIDFDTGSLIPGGILPHVVPIPFGIMYYPAYGIGIGAELAFGSPHIIAVQAGFRL